MGEKISAAEKLAAFQELYDEFKKETPSSPRWFQIIDVCVGTLMAERLIALDDEAKTPLKAGE